MAIENRKKIEKQKRDNTRKESKILALQLTQNAIYTVSDAVNDSVNSIAEKSRNQLEQFVA